MDEQPQALTVEQVAERLQIDPQTVERLILRGQLRGDRVGPVWRVPVKAVEEYLHGAHPRLREGREAE